MNFSEINKSYCVSSRKWLSVKAAMMNQGTEQVEWRLRNENGNMGNQGGNRVGNARNQVGDMRICVGMCRMQEIRVGMQAIRVELHENWVKM